MLFKNLKKVGSAFIALLALKGCTTRARWNNYFWELDSLRYYTSKQSKEITQLRADLYTKMEELTEKLEMLNNRLSETEALLATRGRAKSAVPDTGEGASIPPEARITYESAYLNYVKGNYSEAISGFKSYLKVAPNSSLSDNALYWIGECYYAMGKMQEAVDTFNELKNVYPESNKVPTALYKIGLIYKEAKDLKTARMYFERVLTEFPNSPEANLAKTQLKK
ncbi:MAG: tol-pal system protein YbgF [candidate division WOR-3 bacterium]